jgi:hypothetical protein
MTLRTIRMTALALVVGMLAVPVALASVEPRNEPPFTRHVAVPTSAGTTTEAPTVALGEAKNGPPFTRSVTETVVVASGARRFSWSDAGIGLLAGFGLAAACLGGVVLAGSRRRVTRQTA